jgi:hypothetical protein
MKYLKRFNENIENIEYDFNDSNYDAETKSIIAAYMIIEDSEKSITVLNIKEFEDRRSIFVDGYIPYTIEVNKVKLPKSQIQIIGEVSDIPGFNWIKIPYWLVRNNPGLKILRIKDRKRLYKMHPKLDDDVLKYLSSTKEINK